MPVTFRRYAYSGVKIYGLKKELFMMTPSTTLPVFDMMRQETIQSLVHDIRTPMTVIKASLQLLLSGVMGQMSSEQTQLIRHSVQPLEDVILLTENLLQSMTLQEKDLVLKTDEIDLDRLLAEAIEFYRLPFQQRSMQIFREGNTVGVKIRADAFWLRRALNNLIWNAFKFTPDQGKVALHVEHKEGGLEISVTDTGRGIPVDRLDRIFERSQHPTPSHDGKLGNGLGLWICKRVMELHGGRIRVDSALGQGSTFFLWFPYNRVL